MGIHIPDEDIQEARRVSLLDFLRQNRPAMYSNISRVGSQYVVKARYFGTKGQYSSFMIRASTGDWWHHSKGTHGRNALDYLIKEEGMDFPAAVLEVLGRTEDYYKNQRQAHGGSSHSSRTLMQDGILPPLPMKDSVQSASVAEIRAETVMTPQKPDGLFPEEKELIIPERDTDTKELYAYLTGRGIDSVIIDFFVDRGSLYQGAKYKNVCFVGYDREGNPGLINQRATKGTFKGNSTGSDRRYSFMHHAEGQTEVHVFEAPIDMLSYACLIHKAGYDFRKFNLISLSGISGTGSGMEVRLPMGMEEYLERYPDTLLVYIHFDNDEPGHVAGQRLKDALADGGIPAVLQYPPTGCKDVNDYLMGMNQLEITRSKRVEAGL